MGSANMMVLYREPVQMLLRSYAEVVGVGEGEDEWCVIRRCFPLWLSHLRQNEGRRVNRVMKNGLIRRME